MLNKICVVGLGYIGLPTLITLAMNEFVVIGIDKNPEVVNKLCKGEIHINEPNLQDKFKMLLNQGNMTISNNIVEADAFMICVPTPVDEELKCDLSYIVSALDDVCKHIKKGDTIIIESTIPPTTIQKVAKPIIESRGFKVGEDIYLAHCPERVLPGNIMNEIINNNRIIGGCTEKCGLQAKKIYSKFVKGEIILTDSKVAEMSKLYENTFRDINIAIANELIMICNDLGIDGLQVIEYANKHPRVDILKPGPGVGGHCLAVDPYFIVEKTKKKPTLVQLARDVNSNMPSYVCSKVQSILKDVDNPKVVVFGLTYKENIDDDRESPAIKVVELLKSYKYDIVVCDPQLNINAKIDENIASDADMILVLTAHSEFLKLDYKKMVKYMRRPIIFDTRNELDIKDSSILYFNFGNVK